MLTDNLDLLDKKVNDIKQALSFYIKLKAVITEHHAMLCLAVLIGAAVRNKKNPRMRGRWSRAISAL